MDYIDCQDDKPRTYSWFFIQTGSGKFVRCDQWLGNTVYEDHDQASAFSTRELAQAALDKLPFYEGDHVVEIEYIYAP